MKLIYTFYKINLLCLKFIRVVSSLTFSDISRCFYSIIIKNQIIINVFKAFKAEIKFKVNSKERFLNSPKILFNIQFVFNFYNSHSGPTASLGIRQSPRGDKLIDPTFGPSGMQERLNCWA